MTYTDKRDAGFRGWFAVKSGRAENMSRNASSPARDAYKVRISKGFVDADFGEGFLVEVWDYRSQRIIYGERFHDLERARRREKEIKSDLDSMSIERFLQSYARKRA